MSKPGAHAATKLLAELWPLALVTAMISVATIATSLLILALLLHVTSPTALEAVDGNRTQFEGAGWGQISRTNQ